MKNGPKIGDNPGKISENFTPQIVGYNKNKYPNFSLHLISQ
jgi:hypothetical protein